MRIEHRLEVTTVCPVDGKPDVYECVVRTSRLLPVEDILTAAKDLSGKKLYQEDLTQELHRRLAAAVETRGCHSGVRTRVVCGDGA